MIELQKYIKKSVCKKISQYRPFDCKLFGIFANSNYIVVIVPKSNQIIENLDRFIRKYYKNRLIKGALYAVALLMILFLAMIMLEHFGYFSTTVRTFFFWFYVAAMVAILWRYVLIPLSKMYRMGKCISYEEAARIVGNHFPDIEDKLLNLLQLQHQYNGQSATQSEASPLSQGNELLQAAIEQKTRQMSPIPFVNAIDLRVNVKYVKIALIPLALLLVLLIVAPSFIMEPSKRIINHSTAYERPAPFAFVVQNKSLQTAQQEDFTLQVAIKGDAIPNEAFINIEGKVYKMQPKDKTHYTYLFKNVQSTQKFHLQATGVESADYELTVFPKPTVINFQALLSYPAYTGKKSEVLSNIGDLTVPQGTTIKWVFQTKDADTLNFVRENIVLHSVPNNNGRLSLTYRALQSFNYGFSVTNHQVRSGDTLKYAVSVISDCAPMIAAMEMRDSLASSRIFFKGHIKDDYGFTKLQFKLVKTNAKDTASKLITSTPIGISNNATQEFYFSTNLDELNIQPGDRIRYYFEVWDNDAVNGPKSATSQTFEIEVPSEQELDNILEQNTDAIQEKAESSISELKKLQEEINEMMRRLVDKKNLNWQDKKQLQELQEKQKQVKEAMQKMQQQIQENNRLEERYRQQSEQIMEKQKELDKLFDQVMTDEMKELMKQIDQLMNEADKKKVQEQLENLKLKNEDVERQLDQNIELMKRLEIEKRVEETIKRVDKLSEKQKELSQKTEDARGKEKEELQKQQQQLSQEFQELKKDINEIQKDYKQLDPSQDFKIDKNLENRIQQQQQNAENQLGKGKNKEASQQQKSAAEDLEKLSEQMAEAQMDMEQQDLAEDAEMVRQLLKNIVRLSFNQESLIKTLNSVYIQDPKYQQIIADQSKVKSDFRNVADSLQSMARRQVAVASAINKELGKVNSNLEKSLSGLVQYNQSFYGNMKNTQSAQSMQYTMTSLNNLALVLAESLDQMQNQMRQNQQQKKQGSCKKQGNQKKSGSCSNPGNKKPSPKSMKEMQDALNKQMEALKKQLEKQGNKPGRAKIGEQGTVNEEFARMAAQQEQIRRMMQEYGQEMKQQSGGNSKMAREIDEMMRQMEETETDLVNKTITQQTIRRQQQIMTRLLEHEKADLQREKEDRRDSREGKDIFHPSPADMERFNKMKESNLQLFQSAPPTLSNYYKNKVNEYFYKF